MALQLFLDTANLTEIAEAASWNVISGVTTNPTLVAKEKEEDFSTLVRRIAELVPGPVSAEVISVDAAGMVAEARALAAIAPNVIIKVPMTAEGLKAVGRLAGDGIKTNVTLVFSANQGLLAALAGATYVSPFIGRLDDIGHDGMEVVADLVGIFKLHNLPTKVIAASIRHPLHVLEAARRGAHVATVPFSVLQRMLRHPLTDGGIERFLADWKSVQNQLK